MEKFHLINKLGGKIFVASMNYKDALTRHKEFRALIEEYNGANIARTNKLRPSLADFARSLGKSRILLIGSLVSPKSLCLSTVR